jgi:hypothetical protein
MNLPVTASRAVRSFVLAAIVGGAAPAGAAQGVSGSMSPNPGTWGHPVTFEIALEATVPSGFGCAPGAGLNATCQVTNAWLTNPVLMLDFGDGTSTTVFQWSATIDHMYLPGAGSVFDPSVTGSAEVVMDIMRTWDEDHVEFVPVFDWFTIDGGYWGTYIDEFGQVRYQWIENPVWVYDIVRTDEVHTLQTMFASDQQISPFDSTSDLGTLTMVPEPETWAMLMAGLGVLAIGASRRRAGAADRLAR